MTGLAATLLSIMMIAAVLLAAGGIALIRRGKAVRKGVLMLIAAAVMIGNVLIWTL
jgi:hypothetical protein